MVSPAGIRAHAAIGSLSQVVTDLLGAPLLPPQASTATLAGI